ncbi:MAG TPA: polysaccharide deacetylase family protein [Saprospiraceae bacterium]|nr:polysaccharide deacetylase family protein [Saprospiraceae bacterium]
MVTVYIPNNFLPERTYAVRTLLQHYLGIEVHVEARKGQIHYELSWADKSIIIRDQFFGHTIVGQTYLKADRIPEIAKEATQAGLDNCVIIYGEDHVVIEQNQITCAVDVFAGAFFMLTRWEESLGLYEDLHGRFPADKALIVKSGFILRPVVDEYVALMQKWLLHLNYPVPPAKGAYKVVPTCDVDMPFFWLKKPRWKVLMGQWKKNKKFSSFKATRQKIKAVESGTEKDPYDTFDYMMSLAEKANISFDFNMLVGGISKYEGYYSVNDPMILSLMKNFKARGHRIGLHPSYNSFLDRKLIFEEKQILAKHIDTPVRTSRQHYLRFSVSATGRYLEDANIKEDSTLGYAAEPGFRCGTCKPFPIFDVALQKTLSLFEHPLLIMDVSFRFYKKYTPEQSIALCAQIIEQVKKHNGELVFLWHNSNLSEVEDWSEWRKVFEYLITP